MTALIHIKKFSMRDKIKALAVFLLLMIPIITGTAVFLQKGRGIISTDIGYLLPHLTQNGESSAYFTEKLSRELLFVFRADGETEVSGAVMKQTLQEFTAELNAFDFVRVRNFADMEKTGSLLFAHRYALGADDYLTGGRPDPEKLREEVLSVLYSPFGGATEKEIRNDPFFTMRHYLGRQTAGRYSLDPSGFAFITDGGNRRNYVISASLSASDLSSSQKSGLFDFCRKLKRNLQSRKIDFLYTGAFFFAEEAASSSENDISKISIGSGIMLVILLLFFFRSVKPLVSAVAVLSLAMFSAFGTVITVFGSMHVITIAIGASLAGISFDYILHVLVRRAHQPGESPAEIRKKLGLPLTLSLITSVLAYGVTSFTGLNVLRELGVFASVVLTGTFLLSCYCLSLSRLRRISASSSSLNVLAICHRGLVKIPRSVSAAAALLTVTAACCLMFVSGADDDVASLRQNRTELAEMDMEINRTVNGDDGSLWFILDGDSLENAMESCEDFLQTLASDERMALEAPCLKVPSERAQRSSIENYRTLYPALKDVYAEQGFILDDGEVSPDGATTFKVTDMPLFSDFMTGEKSVLVRANSHNAGLIQKIRSFRGFSSLDRRKDWSEAFGVYRQELNRMLLIALVLIFAAGALVLRTGIVTSAVLPLTAGLGAGIIADYCITGSFNLFTTVALFVVTGLGADYCVFIRNMKEDSSDNTLATLSLAWISTEVSCGLLMLSDMPAVVNMGAVIFWGLAVIPVTALMLKKQQARTVKLSESA